jgi:asparagine synthetase B (glutamine-hydrolysing)
VDIRGKLQQSSRIDRAVVMIFLHHSRHRAKFQQGHKNDVAKELELDLDRIWERNMGRDNRVLCDHGIAPRFPFLDENVVQFFNSLRMEDKMDFRLKRGVGDKLLLRALSYRMGIRKTASEPKRAIQFGSRIAKMENRKEKGSDKAIRY